MRQKASVEPQRSAVRAWLLVRVALASVVLGLAYSLFSPHGDFTQTETTIVMETLVVFTIFSSFAVAAYVERGGSTVHSGRLLLVLDILVVSVSVGVTGGAGSVLSVLYGAVILGASTTLGSGASFGAGLLALACYGAVAIGLSTGAILPPIDQPPHLYALSRNDLVFALASNGFAIVLVSVLSNWLALQLARTGGALAISETNVDRLAKRSDAITRSIRAGLVTLDTTGRITSANPAAIELLRSTEAALLGMPIANHFPELDLLKTSSPPRAETRGIRADGSEFPAGYSSSSLEAAEDDASEHLFSFQDLTSFRRLEEAARDAEQLATLGRVAATLAHEIRNPLGSISGSVELVRENEELPEEDRDLLALVVKEVERIEQLVRDMLDVAKRREPRFEPHDLHSLCDEVARLAARRSEDVAARVSVAFEGPFEAVFDSDMLRQIVWNLVSNAVQASADGGEVTIRATPSVDGGFELFVEDEGKGIPEADLDRIFDPFHTGRARGMGLGLALVRQLVALHEGTASASNRKPRGARVRIKIPQLTTRSSAPDATRGGQP